MRCGYHNMITNLDSLGLGIKWLVWAAWPGRSEEGRRERWASSQVVRIKGGGGPGSQGHRDWKVVGGEWGLVHRLEGEDSARKGT